jgi:hypothetical protein
MLSGRATELLGVAPDLIPPGLERLAIAEDASARNWFRSPGKNNKPGQNRTQKQLPYETSGHLPDPALLWRKRRQRTGESAGCHSQIFPERCRLSFPDKNLSQEQAAAVRMALENPVSC